VASCQVNGLQHFLIPVFDLKFLRADYNHLTPKAAKMCSRCLFLKGNHSGKNSQFEIFFIKFSNEQAGSFVKFFDK
jgi:hypothetical protein